MHHDRCGGYSLTRKKLLLALAAACLLSIGFASRYSWAQNGNAGQNQTQAQNQRQAQPQNGGQAPGAGNSLPDETRIIQFLDQTIAWYRQLGAEQQLISNASDSIFVSGNRQAADEVVRLAFQYARAEAQPSAAPAKVNSTQGPAQANGAQPAANPLAQRQAKADQEVKDLQKEVDDFRVKAAAATAAKKQTLQDQLAETTSELELAKAQADAVRNMAQFVNQAANGANDLKSQVEALAATLPANLTSESPKVEPPAAATQPATPAAQAAQAQVQNAGDASGLWEAAQNIFTIWGKLRSIDLITQQTQALERRAREIRTPMGNQLRELNQRGDDLAKQADTADAATLLEEKQQLDGLTQEFRNLTASVVPIVKAGILLNLYQKNLANWRTNVRAELLTDLRSLALRISILVIIIAAVLGASELWRRAIFRYSHDVRRRSQLHWMRKFVVWFVIGLIVAFSFASHIGSIATFAGLLTAGIALALQNVIQSVVGYFFLIGKYGIRTGDHVQIGGVTGEVVDVGLVRIHMMEMGGISENAPTGRVVAFSNSIVFQPTAGLFKQIPGTNFAWHEITLSLPSETNFGSVRERLMKAVEAGLADYKEEIGKQHSALENTFDSAPGIGLEPTVQVQFTGSGLEAVVRYPVALRHASEIDDRITRALLSDLDMNHAGSPAIRLKTS